MVCRFGNEIAPPAIRLPNPKDRVINGLAQFGGAIRHLCAPMVLGRVTLLQRCNATIRGWRWLAGPERREARLKTKDLQFGERIAPPAI